MTVKGGYFGKILCADMTDGKVSIQGYDDDFALRYVGGRGFGAKLVWDNLQKQDKVDPLGPENLLVVAPGPLSGLYLPASG